MKKIQRFIFIISGILILTGCSMSPGISKSEESAGTAAVSYAQPPQIELADVLSGTYAPFQVNPSSYSWISKKGNDEESVVACGSGPLTKNVDLTELEIPDYNQMEKTIYSLNCEILPDKITVKAWNQSDIGNDNAQEVWSEQYNTSCIELEKNMVFELSLTWEKEKQEERGFSGEASYIFKTK